MLPKLGWDSFYNQTGTVLITVQNRLTDLEFMRSTRGDIDRLYAINRRMQRLFREWHELEQRDWKATPGLKGGTKALFEALVAHTQTYSDDELREQLRRQVQTAEAMAVSIFCRAAATALDVTIEPDRTINPYAISMRRDDWEIDGLYAEPGWTPEDALELAAGVENLWLEEPTHA
jgi:hypothetical protein